MPTVEAAAAVLGQESLNHFLLFYFFFVFALAGPQPHIPFPPDLIFLCKFSRHGSSSPVTSYQAPSITVLVLPDSADACSCTTASYRLTQLFRPNTREESVFGCQ